MTPRVEPPGSGRTAARKRIRLLVGVPLLAVALVVIVVATAAALTLLL